MPRCVAQRRSVPIVIPFDASRRESRRPKAIVHEALFLLVHGRQIILRRMGNHLDRLVPVDLVDVRLCGADVREAQ